MDNLTKETIKAYKDTAIAYIKNSFSFMLGQHMKIFYKYCKQGGLVLDLACGPGASAKILTEAKYKVIGVDLCSVFLEEAKKRVPKAKFLDMDIRKLEFPDNKFDAVFARGSHVHLQRKEVLPSLREAHRVLKKGGLFYFAVKLGKDEDNDGWFTDARYDNVKKWFLYFSNGEIKKLVVKAGFEVKEELIAMHEIKHDTHEWINIYAIKK